MRGKFVITVGDSKAEIEAEGDDVLKLLEVFPKLTLAEREYKEIGELGKKLDEK